MKKSLIAASASAVALAAMPVVGVFAANNDGTLTYTDTITATIDSACSIARGSQETGTYDFGTITSAAAASVDGSTFAISCNDTGNWQFTALGASDATTKTSMDSSTSKDTDDIVTGTTFDGTVSNWAFKLSNATNVDIASGYDGWSLIPGGSTATVIASGTPTTTGSVKTSYNIRVKDTQAAGTYTGKVTYTLVHPAV